MIKREREGRERVYGRKLARRGEGKE